MKPLISVVVGNPKPESRTLRVARTLAERLFPEGIAQIEVVDLCDYTDEILRWPSERMSELNERVAASDIVVFGSPTYKATYTGLLKAFLDRYPANGLTGVTAIPVMTGAGLGHTMGPTWTLMPLLAELGAIVPGRGFYFSIERMDRLDEIVDEAAEEYRGNLARVTRIGSALSTGAEPASGSPS